MAPENDSNFQRDNPRDNLTVASTRGTRRGKVEITFTDGSSFFIIEDIQKHFGIYKGCSLSPQEKENLLNTSESREAEQKALSLLAAPHSRLSLELKLRKRGFSPRAVEHAVNRAKDLGYLNDAQYAEEWIHSRLRTHPEGRYALLAGLLRKGITRQMAEECVKRIVTVDVEADCGRRLLDRYPSLRALPVRKLEAKLSTRGFHGSVVRNLLANMGNESDRESGLPGEKSN